MALDSRVLKPATEAAGAHVGAPGAHVGAPGSPCHLPALKLTWALSAPASTTRPGSNNNMLVHFKEAARAVVSSCQLKSLQSCGGLVSSTNARHRKLVKGMHSQVKRLHFLPPNRQHKQRIRWAPVV